MGELGRMDVRKNGPSGACSRMRLYESKYTVKIAHTDNLRLPVQFKELYDNSAIIRKNELLYGAKTTISVIIEVWWGESDSIW